jgi:hypothetical protein
LLQSDGLRYTADVLRDAGAPVDEWLSTGDHEYYKNMVSLYRLYHVQITYEFWSFVKKILERHEWAHKLDVYQGENVAWRPRYPYDPSDVHILAQLLIPFFPEGKVTATYDRGDFWVVIARPDGDARIQVWDRKNSVPRHQKNSYALTCTTAPYWTPSAPREEDRVTRECHRRAAKNGPSYVPTEGMQLFLLTNKHPMTFGF